MMLRQSGAKHLEHAGTVIFLSGRWKSARHQPVRETRRREGAEVSRKVMGKCRESIDPSLTAPRVAAAARDHSLKEVPQ